MAPGGNHREPQRVITRSSLCTLGLTASLSFACREGTEREIILIALSIVSQGVKVEDPFKSGHHQY